MDHCFVLHSWVVEQVVLDLVEPHVASTIEAQENPTNAAIGVNSFSLDVAGAQFQFVEETGVVAVFRLQSDGADLLHSEHGG